MGSETPLRLPVLDFSTLKPGTPEWDSVKAQVRQALEMYGCFEFKYDKIPSELRKAIFGAVEELFDLPLQTKSLNHSEKIFHGFVTHPHIPLYESMGIEEANIIEKVESMTNILWPEGNASFSKSVQSFSEEVSELDQTVRRMILESFGLEKYMDEHMNSTYYLLRFTKYKRPQTTEKKVGLTSHTDKLIGTILYQNQVDGLEVQTKDGEWLNIKPSFDSFTFMIGDCLYAWINGRLYSQHHRVMMTGSKPRYSVGLFSVPKPNYLIKAPKEVVDEAHPLLFKPFLYSEFLKFYQTKEGQTAKSALKTYCGV